VRGVDVVPRVVETINRGQVHLVEPDLEALVRAGVEAGQLHASLEPQPADVFVIAVPTPFTEGHRPDLRHVEAAADALAPSLAEGALVILESTSPVGTTEALAERLRAARPDLALLRVAYCPERVLPGRILHELVYNDRVVGGVDPASTEAAAAFYQTFVAGQVLRADARTAELTKLTENAFRDVNIAFANELSAICGRLGVDVWDLIRLANHHPRVNILQPGPGVGGHCIAVDPWFIVHSCPEEAVLVRAARQVNDDKTARVLEGLRRHLREHPGQTLACLGLAYKPDIDDLRESPALRIALALRAEFGERVLVVEPNLDQHPTLPLLPLEEAIDRADAVAALVGHQQLKALDRRLLQGKALFDAVGVFR
jgi:UDP-N-acetyl-D-mannosaminuronic acid dehydrogenase